MLHASKTNLVVHAACLQSHCQWTLPLQLLQWQLSVRICIQSVQRLDHSSRCRPLIATAGTQTQGQNLRRPSERLRTPHVHVATCHGQVLQIGRVPQRGPYQGRCQRRSGANLGVAGHQGVRHHQTHRCHQRMRHTLLARMGDAGQEGLPCSTTSLRKPARWLGVNMMARIQTQPLQSTRAWIANRMKCKQTLHVCPDKAHSTRHRLNQLCMVTDLVLCTCTG
jgi:hypothetical protein